MTVHFLLLALLAQAPAAAAQEPAAPEPPPPREQPVEKEGAWDASIGLGLDIATGNAGDSSVTLNVLAERDTPRWSLMLEGIGAYGSARVAGETDSQLTALRLRGAVRAERRLTPRWGIFGLAGAETDHLASLELRTEAELGVGLTLLERGREERDELFLRVDVGAAYVRDWRFQYEPTRRDLEDVELLSPSLGLTLRYDINERLSLREYARVRPDLIGDTRVLATSTTKLTVGLTRFFALVAFYELQHDSAPAPGTASTTTSLTMGAEVTF